MSNDLKNTMRLLTLLSVLLNGLFIGSTYGQGLGELNVSDAIQGEKVVSIRFEGNKRVESAALSAALFTKTDKPLNLSQVQSDIRSIWNLGVFIDVQVRYEDVTDGVVLIYEVTEKSAIRKIFIEGNDGLGLDKINEALTLQLDSILDVSKVKENETLVRNKYVEEGYYLAEVKYEIKPVSEGEVDVWFTVTENDKVSIQDVSFVGNLAFSDDKLRQSIQTRKSGGLSFLSSGGTFNQEAFDQDLIILQAFYAEEGYWQAKIGAPALKLSRDKAHIYLSIPIEEGPQFKVGSIDFKGDLMGPKSEYYRKLATKKGQIFRRSRLATDVEGLANFYKDKGYAYANIQPNMPFDQKKLVVDLTFEIEKGSKVFFERINVRGNSTTRDKVIRREMVISEGDLYSQTKMDVSESRINALGFFENVNISTTKGSSEEYVVVNVEISEKPTGTFQVGAGFSSIESFILQAQIQKNNLFGRGQTMGLNAQLSSLRQIFSFSFVEPYFLDTKFNMGVSLYNQGQGFGATAAFARNAIGGRMSFGYPFTFETRGSLAYKLERVTVGNINNFFSQGGTQNSNLQTENVANLYRSGVTSSVTASMSYDSRNNRLFPTGGFFLNSFLEVADEFTQSQNVFVRYGGWARHYRRLFGPFVLRLNSEFGVTTSRLSSGVPITERYFIGGIFNVRGFRPRSLGPKLGYLESGDFARTQGQLPLGGNLQLIWNSEIEFSLFKQIGISGVVFFDAGNAFNLEDRHCTGTEQDGSISPKIDPCFDFPTSIPGGLRYSVGFGFRWLSPMGPLRFEWGIPLDRQSNEQPLVFEFTIGQFF